MQPNWSVYRGAWFIKRKPGNELLYLLVREPSVCLHQSYGIVFQIPSRMLQAWTLSKLHWNLIYIHINLCFPFFALLCLYFSCIFILFVVFYLSALHPLEKALYKYWYCIVLNCIVLQNGHSIHKSNECLVYLALSVMEPLLCQQQTFDFCNPFELFIKEHLVCSILVSPWDVNFTPKNNYCVIIFMHPTSEWI